MVNFPIFVLWDPRFTPTHPFYRFSFLPGITKTRMAKDLLGVDLPKEADGPGLVQVSNAAIGAFFYIGTWEQFLQIATPKQIADVMECLEYTSQPEAQVTNIIIPDGPHGII